LAHVCGHDQHPPETVRLTVSRLLDGAERIAIVVLYIMLVHRFIGDLAAKPANLLFIFSEGLIAVMVLLRRGPRRSA
jgi:hypothetical protein